MARPQQKGLLYFPFDVDFFSDKKIKILKARYGADGINIYLYLLCEIYKNGYYLKLDKDYEFVMADDLNMSEGKIKQILAFLLERSLFNNKLFQSDTVLTSPGIQRRFQEAIREKAKKNPREIESFWILSEEETLSFIKVRHNENYSGNNEGYSGNNGDNSENNDTKKRKEKEKKEKEMKEKEKKEISGTVVVDNVLKFYTNNINALPPKYEIDKLLSWSDILTDDLMIRGIQIAIENGKRHLNYIQAIYKSWEDKGIKTFEQYEANERIRKDSTNNVQSSNSFLKIARELND